MISALGEVVIVCDKINMENCDSVKTKEGFISRSCT
jgi:hypothetical protein